MERTPDTTSDNGARPIPVEESHGDLGRCDPRDGTTDLCKRTHGGIARSSMARVMSVFWPYLLVPLAGLLVVAFVPRIILVLPEKFLGLR